MVLMLGHQPMCVLLPTYQKKTKDSIESLVSLEQQALFRYKGAFNKITNSGQYFDFKVEHKIA